MCFRSLVAATIIGGLPVGGVFAAETIEIATEHLCVASLEGKGSLPGGIANGKLADRISVTLCDGSSGQLVFAGAKPQVVNILKDAVPVPRVEPVHKLPDGEITPGQDRIGTVWLSGPTRRYNHAILGDDIEASGLALQFRDGGRASFELGPESVFEDLRVRVIDLNGDKQDELLVIRSYLEGGAALAVYGLEEEAIVQLGETTAIGLSHRWLNPAGAADFDGDGDIEIAYVETPHIGGMLRFISLTPKGVLEEQALHGFSNHAIGSRELDMAAVIDWNGDGILDLAVPDASRSRLQIVSAADGKAKVIASLPADGRHAARITTAVVASDLERDGVPELAYGLSDGTLILIKR